VYKLEGSYTEEIKSSAGYSTLEQNITAIDNRFAKLWPFLYILDGRQPPSYISETQKLHH